MDLRIISSSFEMATVVRVKGLINFRGPKIPADEEQFPSQISTKNTDPSLFDFYFVFIYSLFKLTDSRLSVFVFLLIL